MHDQLRDLGLRDRPGLEFERGDLNATMAGASGVISAVSFLEVTFDITISANDSKPVRDECQPDQPLQRDLPTLARPQKEPT